MVIYSIALSPAPRVFYQKSGGNRIFITAALCNDKNEIVKGQHLPLKTSLQYKGGRECDNEKIFKAYVNSPCIDPSTGVVALEFRIEHCSKNHQSQYFQIVVDPLSESHVKGALTNPIWVRASRCLQKKSRDTHCPDDRRTKAPRTRTSASPTTAISPVPSAVLIANMFRRDMQLALLMINQDIRGDYQRQVEMADMTGSHFSHNDPSACCAVCEARSQESNELQLPRDDTPEYRSAYETMIGIFGEKCTPADFDNVVECLSGDD